MNSLLTSFLVSLILTFMIVYTQKFHNAISGDLNFDGPQKFHLKAVPRVGGVAILCGIIAGIMINMKNTAANSDLIFLTFAAIIPFLAGMAEDLTKKVSVSTRMFFISIGALIFTFIPGELTIRFDIQILDLLMSIPVISIPFTIFAITGLTNSYNIIDGFNGLSSMIGMIALACISYVAMQLNDLTVSYLALLMLSSILGFFIWNFPRGHIFLGDGGAYLIGFWIASLSVLLEGRHSEVSPWFVIMINAYPVLETLFSIYRRKYHQKKSPGHPDGLHFHSLIYRRILHKPRLIKKDRRPDFNYRTSLYIWLLQLTAIIPAIIFWDSTLILISCAILFICLYIKLYKSIVLFQTPRWLL